jgi:hypothetical protein
MNLDAIDWTKAVSGAVLPVVLISACSLMSLAFYNRLAAIVGRLRTFQREGLKKLDEIQMHGDAHPSAQRARRLIDLQVSQTNQVLRRARFLRCTLVCLLTAIGLLLLSSMGLGLGAIISGSLILPSVICFFGGAAFVLVAVVFAIAELRAALAPIEMESEFVRELAIEF